MNPLDGLDEAIKQIPKTDNPVLLMNISLKCIEQTEELIVKMLKNHAMHQNKKELEKYLININTIAKPQILQEKNVEKLREYAKSSVEMLRRIFNAFKKKM